MYACICGKPSPGLVVLPGAEGVRPELYVLTPYVARDGILTRQTKEPPRRSSLVGLTNLKLRVSSFCRMLEGFDQSFTGHLATLYGQRWHTDESDKRTPARRGSLGGFGVGTTTRGPGLGMDPMVRFVSRLEATWSSSGSATPNPNGRRSGPPSRALPDRATHRNSHYQSYLTAVVPYKLHTKSRQLHS